MRRYHYHGFTLLELLVSAAVLSLISVIIAQVLFTTVRLNTKTEQIKEMKQSGVTVMETMKRMIQNSLGVVLCDGTSQSDLTIRNLDGGETTFSCKGDDTYATLTYRIASTSSILATDAFLSSGNVSLVGSNDEAGCSLQFTCTTLGVNGSSVVINFRMRQKNSQTGIFEGSSEVFQSVATTRNTE